MSARQAYSILFVCLGNICRSPTAEAIVKQKVHAIIEDNQLLSLVHVDSAGTSAHHSGQPPDSRSILHAEKRGYDLHSIRSRQIIASDFSNFDLIIAMDRSNLQSLKRLCEHSFEPKQNLKHQDKIKLLLDYSEQQQFVDVPDPYYGGAKGFDKVIDLIEDASHGLLTQLVSITK